MQGKSLLSTLCSFMPSYPKKQRPAAIGKERAQQWYRQHQDM
jgi:hypothetical protein